MEKEADGGRKKKKKNSRVKSLEPGEKKVLGMKEGAIKM